MWHQNLYNVLKNVTYTPCKVSVPSSSGLACGQIVHVKDARGREFDTYLMSATISSGKASFESVSSASWKVPRREQPELQEL